MSHAYPARGVVSYISDTSATKAAKMAKAATVATVTKAAANKVELPASAYVHRKRAISSLHYFNQFAIFSY